MEQEKSNKQKSIVKHESDQSTLGRRFGLSPFSLFRDFADEMDRAVHGIAGTHKGAWSPTVDVRHCAGNLVINAELPGLKKDEVKVELTDDAVVIQGERNQEHSEDHEGYHRWERNYGKFYRSIPLPEGAKTDEIKAELQDGVLKVSIPVLQSAKKTRQIPIETKAVAAKA